MYLARYKIIVTVGVDASGESILGSSKAWTYFKDTDGKVLVFSDAEEALPISEMEMNEYELVKFDWKTFDVRKHVRAADVFLRLTGERFIDSGEVSKLEV